MCVYDPPLTRFSSLFISMPICVCKYLYSVLLWRIPLSLHYTRMHAYALSLSLSLSLSRSPSSSPLSLHLYLSPPISLIHLHIGCASVSLDVVIDCTRSAVEENRLFKCLICRSLSCIPPDWLRKGGNLYEKAAEKFTLQDGIALSFPYDGISAKYDANSDSLVVLEVSLAFLVEFS